MIWVTWRQHRTEAWSMLFLLLLILPLLYASGLDIAQGLEEFGAQHLATQLEGYAMTLLVPISLLPLLAGMFIGAPLVAREIEQGTYRLAWTQGITRKTWLRAKFLLATGACLVCFGAITALFLWWNQPVNSALGNWQTFDTNGVVLVAYAVYALVLGITLGVLLGKTVAAMALTIPAFLGTRLLMVWLRQYYLPPLKTVWDFTGSNAAERGLRISQMMVDKAGNEISGSLMLQSCGLIQVSDGSVNSMFTCFQENGFLQYIVYQPDERFWLFQGIESVIFLALSAGLLAFTFWWIKHKLQ